MSDLRIGLGVDAHALADGVPLVLGGVRFDHNPGLGDIGSLFPSGDPSLRGADSLDLLAEAYRQARSAGFELVNADCIVIGEEPRIEPHRHEMRQRLASALGLDESRVNVRATTTDRLGFTGRGEGIAAQAVALLRSLP
jgi:2-C-methyl-D-erythritol 2,4-cyclodiphosphate synthase